MNQNKNFFKYGLSIGGLIIAVFGFYFWNFRGTTISGDPAHWGQIGDYFGGILNPLIGVINIYIFWKLTQELASREENHRQTQNLQYYSTQRIQAIYDFNNRTEQIFSQDLDQWPDELIKFRLYLSFFRSKNLFLFPFLQQEHYATELFKMIEKVSNADLNDKFGTGELFGEFGRLCSNFSTKLHMVNLIENGQLKS